MSEDRSIEKLFDLVNDLRVDMASSHAALSTKMDAVIPVVKQNTDDIGELRITSEQHKKYVSGIGMVAGGGFLAAIGAWVNSAIKGH